MLQEETQTSSKKIMHGEHVLARLNSVRMLNSPSPTYLLRSSGPLTKSNNKYQINKHIKTIWYFGEEN